ncbi:MAG TPA: tetratricopeptide repeat protein, partial [Candidatus Limnocylindrales bacterium]
THLVSAEPGAVVQIRSFGEAMAWMEAERVNLRAAVSAAVAAGWTGLAFDLASQMVKFLDYAGHVSDKISMFETLAAAIEPMGENKVKYFVLNALGNAYQKAGRHREAISVLERAIDGREALGDRRNAAGSRHNLATVYRILGRLDEAVRLEEAALATVREVGCAELEALFLGTGLPLIYQKLGRWDDALGALTRAMALALQRGSPLETGRIAGNLGWLHLRLGQLAEARQQLAAGLEIGRKFGGREAVAHCELGLAVLHSRRGEHAAAIRLGTSAFEVLKTVLPSREAEWCNTLGEVAADAGSHARARTLFERAASLAAQQQERYEHARALAGLGRLLGSRSHLDAAIEQFEATAPHEAARLRAEL